MKSLSETVYYQAGNIKHGNLFCFSDIIVNIVKDTEKKYKMLLFVSTYIEESIIFFRVTKTNNKNNLDHG